MSTYENEPIPRNGGAIRLDYLGWLRPQEISQPTINGTGIHTKINQPRLVHNYQDHHMDNENLIGIYLIPI